MQSLAQVLREHDATTVQNLVTRVLVERVEQRVGGSGAEPVEHDTSAADLREPESTFDHLSDTRYGGDFFVKILRQNISRVAVGGVRSHPYGDIRNR